MIGYYEWEEVVDTIVSGEGMEWNEIEWEKHSTKADEKQSTEVGGVSTDECVQISEYDDRLRRQKVEKKKYGMRCYAIYL